MPIPLVLECRSGEPCSAGQTLDASQGRLLCSSSFAKGGRVHDCCSDPGTRPENRYLSLSQHSMHVSDDAVPLRTKEGQPNESEQANCVVLPEITATQLSVLT